MKKIGKRILSLSLIILFCICSSTPLNHVKDNILNDEIQNELTPKSSNNGISILTPENITYTDSMEGYYPATHGFENEPTGAIDEDIAFIDYGPSSSIILEELDGHKKIIQIYRVGWAATQSNFTPTFEGAVEMWIRVDDSNADQIIAIGESDGPKPGLDRPAVLLTVQYGNIYWASNVTEYNLISAFSSDVWYHLRIDVFSNNAFDVYLNQNLMVSKAQTKYNMTTGMNCLFFKEYDGAAKWYVDAVGYSWDQNYNIRDNLYEGLLVSANTETPLESMSYLLDNQPKRAFKENTTIPMPEDGLHSIQIFGIDIYGTHYKSDIRYFTVDFPINIITPEARTYNQPMSGYYPATYGFESDLLGTDAKDWWHDVVASTHSYLVDSYNGHERVYELYDNNVGGNPDTYNSYIAQSNGTVELWVLVKITGYPFWVQLFYDDSVIITLILQTGGYLKAYNGTNPVAIDMTEYGIIKEDQWYHIRIDFRSAIASPYMGLADDTFRIYLNDTQCNSDLFMTQSSSQVNKIRITTGHSAANSNYYAYFDAVGYSWDPDYNIGDNHYEGLLLSYENNTNLDWIGYSLDGQPNRTISGNTTFSFPNDGRHSIRVFGNNSLGDLYHSNIRYFSVHHINIITPEDKIYIERKNIEC